MAPASSRRVNGRLGASHPLGHRLGAGGADVAQRQLQIRRKIEAITVGFQAHQQRLQPLCNLQSRGRTIAWLLGEQLEQQASELGREVGSQLPHVGLWLVQNAAGGVVNIGDQLHPRGTLDRGAYQVIGEVFAKVEALEPVCVGAEPLADIAVLLLPSSQAEGVGGMTIGAVSAGFEEGWADSSRGVSVSWKYSTDSSRSRLAISINQPGPYGKTETA